MRRSVRAVLLLTALCCLAVGAARADVAVTFPSDNSFYCNINGCDFMGNNGHESAPFFTAGDFLTEIFFTGQPTVIGLSYDFFLIDNLGGNAGASYENDIYINNTLVGSFFVPDCNFCGTQMEYSGTFNFGAIQGDGTYALTIELANTVPAGDGNEIFLAPGNATLIDTVATVPEPGTLALFGSGVLALVGWLRRRSL